MGKYNLTVPILLVVWVNTTTTVKKIYSWTRQAEEWSSVRMEWTRENSQSRIFAVVLGRQMNGN